MKTWQIVLASLALLVVVLVGGYISKNNEIVTLQTVAEQSVGEINSALQKRADLIPNLVETVKGYASHEKEALESVIKARVSATQVKLDASTISDPNKLKEINKAQGELSAALGRLMMVSEQYPALKADKHFSELMIQLESVENGLKIARDNYNKSATRYNIAIKTFPGSLISGGRVALAMFEAEEAAKTAPKVSFAPKS